MPDAPRPIKVSLVWPAIFMCGCVALVVIPIMAAPKDTAIGLMIMLSAVPVYLIFIAWKNKPKFVENISASFTVLVQKLFMVVDDSKEE
ncbi:hypothetical protein NECAME_16550 [Necator americanus]|nr:hypothetical protein NECAME_16550 [Necator americanus]ETN85989.1 hypothetical protein NECAME_16550 [Necator americanus]